MLLPWLLEDGSQQHGAFNEGEIISISPLFLFSYFFFYIFELWFSCLASSASPLAVLGYRL
jgi:hypothetical protein